MPAPVVCGKKRNGDQSFAPLPRRRHGEITGEGIGACRTSDVELALSASEFHCHDRCAQLGGATATLSQGIESMAFRWALAHSLEFDFVAADRHG